MTRVVETGKMMSINIKTADSRIVSMMQSYALLRNIGPLCLFDTM